MSDLDSLGGFLGGEAQPPYCDLWVIATVIEKTNEDGKKYLGYDFPAQPAAVHMPPEIVPAAGDNVTLLVRVPVADKEVWTKYSTITTLGDNKETADAAWDDNVDKVNFAPEPVVGVARPVWKRCKPTPAQIPEEP